MEVQQTAAAAQKDERDGLGKGPNSAPTHEGEGPAVIVTRKCAVGTLATSTTHPVPFPLDCQRCRSGPTPHRRAAALGLPDASRSRSRVETPSSPRIPVAGCQTGAGAS